MRKGGPYHTWAGNPGEFNFLFTTCFVGFFSGYQCQLPPLAPFFRFQRWSTATSGPTPTRSTGGLLGFCSTTFWQVNPGQPPPAGDLLVEPFLAIEVQSQALFFSTIYFAHLIIWLFVHLGARTIVLVGQFWWHSHDHGTLSPARWNCQQGADSRLRWLGQPQQPAF